MIIYLRSNPTLWRQDVMKTRKRTGLFVILCVLIFLALSYLEQNHSDYSSNIYLNNNAVTLRMKIMSLWVAKQKNIRILGCYKYIATVSELNSPYVRGKINSPLFRPFIFFVRVLISNRWTQLMMDNIIPEVTTRISLS